MGSWVATFAMLCALAACSRSAEPAPAADKPAEPQAPAPVANAPHPSPRYVVSGARVLDTERTAQTDAALNAVRRHVHGLMHCYVGVLEQQPTLAGKMVLELSVDPTGTLSNIVLTPSKDDLELVSRCAFDALSGANVALPQGAVTAPLRMHYDLAFSPPPKDPKRTPTVVEPGAAPTAPQ